MDKEELKKRTKQFALRIMKLADSLQNTPSGRTISGQLVRCGTSVGLIIGLRVVGDKKQSLLQNWVLS